MSQNARTAGSGEVCSQCRRALTADEDEAHNHEKPVGPQKRLPSWAEEWAEGQCGCGARVVICRGLPPVPVRVCAKSARNVENCPDVEMKR